MLSSFVNGLSCRKAHTRIHARRMSKRALTETSEEGAAPSPTVLYSYWRSSCSWRVRIGLQFKGIAYEYSAVNLLKSEQTSAEYAATKNPMKAVPTLVIDGLVLTQSGAILEYLEETRPEPALMPKEPAARFQVRRLCDIIGCDIQPVQNLKVLNMAVAKEESKEAKDAGKAAWAKHYITEGFVALEQALAASAGVYSVGDVVTLADVYLVPQVYNAGRFGVDMTLFPTINRVAAALKTLPQFIAADPANQPDAVA